MTVGESVPDDLYDEKVGEEAEEEMLEKYKRERLEEMFPDEVDTPRDVAARIRLVNKSKIISVFLFKT